MGFFPVLFLILLTLKLLGLIALSWFWVFLPLVLLFIIWVIVFFLWMVANGS